MASSSHNTLDESFDDAFDNAFDEKFDQFSDQTFEKLIVSADQEEHKQK